MVYLWMNNTYHNTAQNLHTDKRVSDHVVHWLHKISLDYSQPSREENVLFLQPITTLFPFAGLSALIDLINWREKHLASLDQEKKMASSGNVHLLWAAQNAGDRVVEDCKMTQIFHCQGDLMSGHKMLRLL